MSARLDIINKKFGALTVLRFYSNRNPRGSVSQDKKSYWLCQCICGKQKIVCGLHLVREQNPTRTCGCRTGIYDHRRTFHRHGSAGFRMFHAAKERAKTNDLAFNIEQSDIVVPECCPFCEKKLLRGPKITNASPSLDRLNNLKGYIKGNILVICYQCNGTKRDHTSPDILEKIAKNWRKMATIP